MKYCSGSNIIHTYHSSSLVVIMNQTPPLPEERGTARTAIDHGQDVLPLLTSHDLHLDANVTLVDASKIERLRVDVEKVPWMWKEKMEGDRQTDRQTKRKRERERERERETLLTPLCKCKLISD